MKRKKRRISAREWAGIPPAERLGWYRTNIESLVNYLEGKTTFGVVEKIISRELLDGILGRLEADLEERPQQDNPYRQRLQQVRTALPAPDAPRTGWMPRVKRALQALDHPDAP